MKETKFIADHMLGRLARWLRLLGFDTLTADQTENQDIVTCSLKENRIILTRSERLSRWRTLRSVLIQSDDFREQIRQVMQTCHLEPVHFDAHSRCSLCNGLLETIARELVKKRVPPKVFEEQKEFHVCSHCQKIYWQGSHSPLFKGDLEQILRSRRS